MASLERTIRTDFKALVSNLDKIVSHCEDEAPRKEDYTYHSEVDGSIHFKDTGSNYKFNSLVELREILSIESASEAWIWNLYINVKEQKTGNEDLWAKDCVRIAFRMGTLYGGIEVGINDTSVSLAHDFMESIGKILKASFFIRPEIDPHKELLAKQNNCIEESVNLLERLPEYQKRLHKEFSNEKEVQDFLFPILKSHFSTLQEEDYLPKVAGGASIPDFGISETGVAFEIKFTSHTATFKKLGDEISIDSRKYFGKDSPFKKMIVLIYNASSEPVPANYVADLEYFEEIEKVIISPKIVPEVKTTKISPANKA